MDWRTRLQRVECLSAGRRPGQHELAALRIVLQLRVPPVASPGPLRALAARGESLASYRDGRGASMARRDDREYREYLKEEQRSQRGCIARRMQPDFHHGLLGRFSQKPWCCDCAAAWGGSRGVARVDGRIVS